MRNESKSKTNPAGAKTGTHTWLVLMKAHRAIARHAERSLVDLNMCFSDFAVLELLLHKGEQKVNDIGNSLGLTSGAITTAVDRLEGRRLVERSMSESDRRARFVRLTKLGRKAAREAFKTHSDFLEFATSGLTRTEHATLTALLKKLGKTAEANLQPEGSRANHQLRISNQASR